MVKRIVRPLGALSVIALFTGLACTKYRNNDPLSNSGIMFVQASPDTLPLTVLVNGKETGAPLGFGDRTGYVNVSSGSASLEIRQNARIIDSITADTLVTDSVSMTDSVVLDTIYRDTVYNLLDASVDVDGNRAYSIFAYDTTRPVKYLLLNDGLTTTPLEEKARVRFLQLVPGDSALTLYANNTPVFKDREFADVAKDPSKGAYLEMDPGNYTISLKSAVTDSLTAPPSSVSFREGGIYTLYAGGLPGDTSTPVILHLVTSYEP
ncbi:DUF4397 domain-containing protein [Compostibacter hankyongensis]|uniref:DUF4397 domain-containing protein n=1 Tax=Compostibacter hankyongensis TaxID=1007089 RepID=A0ABP8FPH6_9BACT